MAKRKQTDPLASWKASETKRIKKIAKAYEAKGEYTKAQQVLDAISLINEATFANMEVKRNAVNIILATLHIDDDLSSLFGLND